MFIFTIIFLERDIYGTVLSETIHCVLGTLILVALGCHLEVSGLS